MSRMRRAQLPWSLSILCLVLLILVGCVGSGGDETGGAADTNRVTVQFTSAGQAASLNILRTISSPQGRQEEDDFTLQLQVQGGTETITVTCVIPHDLSEVLSDTCQGAAQSTIEPSQDPQFLALVTLIVSLQVQENLVFTASLTQHGVELFRATEDANGNCTLDADEDTNGNGVIDDALTVDLTANPGSVLVTLGRTVADLAISKTAAPDPAAAGAQLTYTLTVTNNCPAQATDVTVTDTLPVGVTFSDATPTQGSCSHAGGIVSCDLGVLERLAVATIALDVTVDLDTIGMLSNTASVTGTQPDPSPDNNSATSATTVGGADLMVSKSDAPDPITAGQNLTYTLTVTNNGPISATGVTLTDTLPGGVTLLSTTPAAPTCNAVSGSVICTLGALAAGSNTQVTIVVAVAPGTTGLLSNTASVTAEQADPDLANNSSTATTSVVGEADLALAKQDTPDPVQPGALLTYTLTATNNGPSHATGVTISDTLPAGVTFQAAGSSPTCTHANGTVTCTIGALADQAQVMRTIATTVNAGTRGILSNTAVVEGDQGDANAANNSVSIDTEVIEPPVNPNSDITSTDQTLSIDITDPEHAAEVPVNQSLTVSGTVNISAIDAGIVNVLYVIDVSLSVESELSLNQDCNGDGVVNAADDFNGDGQIGNTLDCEISGVIALNTSAADTAGASGGVLIFGSTGVAADVDPAAGDQPFTTPLDANKNGNGTPDLEEVARALNLGTVGLFTAKNVDTGTIFDNALAAMNAAFALQTAGDNIAFFFSDGNGLLGTRPGDALGATVAAGTMVNTLAIGTSPSCAVGTDLRTIADTTGGTCTVVSDPTALSAVLPGGAQATIERVEVSIDGGTPVQATLDALGNWSATFPAGTLDTGLHRLHATVFASDGTEVTASISVLGVVQVGDLNLDGTLDTVDAALALNTPPASQSRNSVHTALTNQDAVALGLLPPGTRLMVIPGDAADTPVAIVGTTAPGSLVQVTNTTNEAIVQVIATATGGFAISIEAVQGDQLVIAIGSGPIRFIASVDPPHDKAP